MLPSAAAERVSAPRRFPIGAELQPDGDVSVRVWAPDHRHVTLVLDGHDTAMTRESDGYFTAVTRGHAGSRYGFRLGDDARVLPDPASRFQPDGPHGLSAVVDPDGYRWRDDAWRGLEPDGQVIYELHVGTFTTAGTWAAAAEKLPELRELGVTVVQMMPVAEFAGEFGWGYDGVAWFAPYHHYGDPDDLRAFVDRAHQLGLGVLLDVVYNHLGPDGCYVCEFAKSCVSERYANEWGEALNFDGPGSEGMRELVLANVAYWVREFHFDGFRFDATQQIFDASDEHVLAAAVRVARAAAGERGLLMIGENEPQDADLVRPRDAGGFGLDALYNDDLHHSARVRLTGVNEAYYSDYRGSAQELLSAVRWGFLFQGQHYSWQKKSRGQPALDLAPARFLAFLENHDQVANSADGRRLATLASPGLLRALTALILLGPSTPLLFHGQERGSTRPFRFFADHHGELGEAVRKGRLEFIGQFVRYAQPEIAERVDPSARETFTDCVLEHGDGAREREWLALHRDLLALRRNDPVLRAGRRPEGALLTDDAFLLRWLSVDGDDRLLLVNLARDVDVASLGEPLLAPPRDRDWSLAWSSEAALYGGSGAVPIAPDRFLLPGRAAILVEAVPRTAHA